MYQHDHPYFDYDPMDEDYYIQSAPHHMESDDSYRSAWEERQPVQPFPQMGPPGFFPPFGQPGQGQQPGAPTSPPPAFVPTQQPAAFAVDPGGIVRCLFRYTYVWLRNRQQFWFYPIFVGRRSIAGFRWNGFRWVYFGIDLRRIQSFTCF